MSSPSSATKPSLRPCAATVCAEMGEVQVPKGATVDTVVGQAVKACPTGYRFLELFFFGTFAPASRASERPMAIACLRLVTRRPERPLFNVPRLRSCIARSTFSAAFFPYLAIHPPVGGDAYACSMPDWRGTSLTAISNDPPGFDVARDAADGEARQIAQALGKLDEAMGVSEAADQAERDANRARALAAAAGDQLEEAREVHVRVQIERGSDVGFRDPLRRLPRARVAEAARTQRDPLRAGHLFDPPVIEQVPFGIVEVHRNRAAARFGRDRPVDARHVMAIAVLQVHQTLQQPGGQTADTRTDHVHPDRPQVTQPDVDRRNREVVQGAV